MRGSWLMARIRSIKPEFWVSEQIAECSTNARLTFVGMWSFSDDNGVHPAKPKKLKAELYPMDDCTVAHVGNWVEELLRAGLIAEFTGSDGAKYWHVTGWAKHQKIDRPSYKYPPPPAVAAQPEGIAFDEGSSNTIDESTSNQIDEGSSKDRRAPPPGVDRSGVDRSGVEKVASSKTRPAAEKAVRGTRLPRDWKPSPEEHAYCVERRPDLSPDAVIENFRDFWVAQPGQKGVKTDWPATWKRWVRGEREPRQSSGGGMRKGLLDADDDLSAMMAAAR
jgi:hypothetical protein